MTRKKNFDQCCSHEIEEILSVYQVGGISNRYNGYTYAIANKQNKSAEEQRSPAYMVSHFEIKKPKVGQNQLNDR